MPSNKLSPRRRAPVKPHICHPPPPPLVGPPTGEYWLAPYEQYTTPDLPVISDLYASDTRFPLESTFTIEWTIPWGKMEQGFSCINHTLDVWEWDPQGIEGHAVLQADFHNGDKLAATCYAIVHVQQSGEA